jgi:hypothetical protein
VDEISGVYIEADVHVRLTITSSALSPETLSERLGIEPTEVHHYGEPRHHGRDTGIMCGALSHKGMCLGIAEPIEFASKRSARSDSPCMPPIRVIH